jgi:hypothetical protein
VKRQYFAVTPREPKVKTLIAVAAAALSLSAAAADGFFPVTPGEPVTPVPMCTVVITFPAGRPDLPELQIGNCPGAEVAIAVALAAALKLDLPATPAPKVAK